MALTVDGAVTMKSPKGEKMTKDFKILNEELCSDTIEYSSMAFNATYEQFALFDAEFTEQAKIEIFSMQTSSQ